MPKLVLPDLLYKKSFFEAFAEYLNEETPPPHYLETRAFFEEDNLEGYIQRARDGRQGKNLPNGYVPWTDYWLVEGNHFLGHLSFRHELSDWLKRIGGHIGYDIRPSERGKGYGSLILKLGLEKAKELGLENVLITCQVGNTASKKIIEKNGGVLEKINPGENGEKDIQLFWIKV